MCWQQPQLDLGAEEESDRHHDVGLVACRDAAAGADPPPRHTQTVLTGSSPCRHPLGRSSAPACRPYGLGQISAAVLLTSAAQWLILRPGAPLRSIQRGSTLCAPPVL